MSKGAALMLRQLDEFVAEANDLIKVVGSPELYSDGCVGVNVSINCEHIESTASGITFNAWEEFHIVAGHDYPFVPPFPCVPHNRFSGLPNVFWGNGICLYRSVEAEWDWTGGIAQFLVRLEDWMKDAGRGELSTSGFVVHPPLTYRKATSHCVVITEDVPWSALRTEAGWAFLRRRKEGYVEIVGWSTQCAKDVATIAAPVLFVPKFTDYEFPENVGVLLCTLHELGYLGQLFAAITSAVRRNRPEDPLYVVIAMRWEDSPDAPSSDLHFVAWHIESPVVRKMMRLHTSSNLLTAAISQSNLKRLATDATLDWCRIMDRRPCVVTRRDVGSPCAWFLGKTVVVWGCGALGGHIAEFLTRAGVGKLILYDRDTVDPGILTRQNFEDSDVNESKVEALRRRLLRIRPDDLEIVGHTRNVLDCLAEAESVADVIIDTTASRAVLGSVEAQLCSWPSRPHMISLVIGHDATKGMAIAVQPEYTGGPHDVSRRTRAELLRHHRFHKYVDEFFPDSLTRSPFVPERGCSDPTFVGSAADCAALAGMLLNCGAQALRSMAVTSATAFCVTLPHALIHGDEAMVRFDWDAETVLTDPVHGFAVRIAKPAMNEIHAEIRRSERTRGNNVETGGLLFGYIDETLRVCWIDVASAPPPDSTHAVNRFTCGTSGTREQNEMLLKTTREATGFIGTWHTHPKSAPLPSAVDINATVRLFMVTDPPPRWTLVLIVGEVNGERMPAVHMFERNDVRSHT